MKIEHADLFISSLTPPVEDTTTDETSPTTDDRMADLSWECLQAFVPMDSRPDCRRIVALVKALDHYYEYEETKPLAVQTVMEQALSILKVTTGKLIQEIKGLGEKAWDGKAYLSSYLPLQISLNDPAQLMDIAGRLTEVLHQTTTLVWSDLQTLPSQVSIFPNLHAINVEDDNLKKLGDEIAGATQLKVLHAGGNQITEISPKIGQLAKLSILSLKNNNLGSFPLDLLSELQGLTVLDLRGNPLPQKQIDLIEAVLKPRKCQFYYTPTGETS